MYCIVIQGVPKLNDEVLFDGRPAYGYKTFNLFFIGFWYTLYIMFFLFVY